MRTVPVSTQLQMFCSSYILYHFILSRNYYQSVAYNQVTRSLLLQHNFPPPNFLLRFQIKLFTLDFNKPKCPRAPWHQWLSFPDKIAITTGEVTLLSKLPGQSGHFLEPTPGKISMKPENTPLENEKHLPKPSFSGSNSLILGGVYLLVIHSQAKQISNLFKSYSPWTVRVPEGYFWMQNHLVDPSMDVLLPHICNAICRIHVFSESGWGIQDNFLPKNPK